MTVLDDHAKASPLAAGQPAVHLRSKIALALNWLLGDMRAFPGWPTTTVLAICIAVATGSSGYLLLTNVTSSPIVGCGSGGGWIDCEGVASSRWSNWFGVPVSLLAFAIYVAMAGALFVATSDRFSRRLREIGWAFVTAAIFSAGMSAIWFIAIQLVVLQHICIYCMLAHACGLVATVTILVASPLRAKSVMAIAMLSLAGFSVLALGQLLARSTATFEIERFDSPSVDEIDAIEFAPPATRNERNIDKPDREPATSTGVSRSDLGFTQPFALLNFLAVDMVQTNSTHVVNSPERVASIQGGRIKLKVADWPHIGPNNATFVIVEMFDYCCPPCRETFKAIGGAQAELKGELTIILLPVPLNSDCNPTVAVTSPHSQESCELSKLAVALWRVAPEAFPSLHIWMLEGEHPPSYAAALAKARTLADPEKLDSEIASGVPDQFIARHVALYKQVGQGSIPKLMFPRINIVGKLTSANELIDLIRREAKSP